MGFAALILLSALAGVAATAVATRLYPRGAGEQLLATLVLWLGNILVPIHVLGWAGALTPGRLGSAVAALSAAAIGITFVGVAPRQRAREIAVGLQRMAATPLRALAEAWRERSIVFVGLLIVYGILLWTAWLTWLAPSGGWDGLTYHEPIVYYAIQNEGFSLVDVPSDTTAQQTNTAPRLGHCVSLWLVIFTDRRLVELAPTLLSPLLLVAVFQMARRYAATKVQAMGWACAVFLVPAIVLQLRSTYQDMIFAAIFAVGVCYATRERPRIRDAWMGALALGLMGGFKFTALLLVPLYGTVLLVRSILRARRERPWAWAATVVGGLLLVGGLTAPTYVRNWVEYDNPVWPRDFHYEAIDLHFEGPYDPYQRKDFEPAMEALFSPPKEGKQYHDSRDNGYGNGYPFVVLPLCLLALPALVIRLLLGVRSRDRSTLRAWNTLLLVGPALGTFMLSPSYDWARYNVYLIVAATILVAWFLGGPRRRIFAEGVIGALIVTGAMTLWWSEPRWGVTLEEAQMLADQSPRDRAAHRLPGNFSMQRRPALLRAKEIGPGDTVAYTIGMYAGILWNEEISNEVHHVSWPGSREAFLRRLDELDAEWVQVRRGGRGRHAVGASPKWEKIGLAVHRNKPLVLYRRRDR